MNLQSTDLLSTSRLDRGAVLILAREMLWVVGLGEPELINLGVKL